MKGSTDLTFEESFGAAKKYAWRLRYE